MTTPATENWTTSWARKKANRWRAVALADSVASLMFKSSNRFALFNCYAPFQAFERLECSQFIPPELRRSVERCQDKGIDSRAAYLVPKKNMSRANRATSS